MILKQKISRLLLAEIALLFLVTCITYLPTLSQATIYRDDWYYTMDRMLGGPSAFPVMFSIDRPARGYFFEIYYRLFGVEPAPYHAAAFAWRMMMGLAALWLFHLLWPKQRYAPFLMALLFVLYPGYTRWMEGFENQPKVVSLFLQAFSIALTLQAIQTKRMLPKIILWIGSIVSGWAYLALVDYAMGMEVFRFLCVFVLVNRDQKLKNWLQKAWVTLRVSAPAVLVLGGFLFWRLFIFHNKRSETDIGLQLGSVLNSPLVRGGWWLVHMLQSVINDAVLAWTAPSFQEMFGMRLSQVFIGVGLAVLAGACLLLGLYLTREPRSQAPVADQPPASPSWQIEATLMGLLGVIIGVLPVVMANRTVTFGPYSHYALPASMAAAVFVVGLVGFLSANWAQIAVMVTIVMLAVINQYTATSRVLHEEQVISNFWHQVVWRAPGIREATGLVVGYPGVTYGEDVDAVNGPANFIYFPEPSNEIPVRYKLQSMKQYPWTIKEFLSGGKVTMSYRTHYGVVDYGYLLVMSQPTEDSCVHIIDQQAPWFSYNDPDPMFTIGPHSNLKNILPNAQAPQLRASIFGPEPVHGWCYYFEKAELANQQQDWQTTAKLAAEADHLQLHPGERMEWMPFLLAYAHLNETDKFVEAASKINENSFNRLQACTALTETQQNGSVFSAEIKQQIDHRFCYGTNP